MRILVFTDVLFPDTTGGAGRVAYHLGCELLTRNHGVHVITRTTNRAVSACQSLQTGFTVHRFRASGQDTPLRFPSEIAKTTLLAKRLTREKPFDMLIAHQSLPALGPAISGSLGALPMIYFFHSPWHEEYLSKKSGPARRPGLPHRAVSFFMKWIEGRVVRRASRVVVLSRHMRDKAAALHLLPRKKISILPGGVDLTRFHVPPGGKEKMKKALSLPLDRTVFLTVRNLVPRMGLENLIEAFHRNRILKEKAFLVIGGEGPLKSALKAIIGRAGLETAVLLAGHIPEQDLPGFYQGADFSVLPTGALEGFGLVILEAMACGTPVLGTPVGAIPEVIGPFDRRLLFDGAGWQDMARRMETLLHPDLYRFDAWACRRYVERNYSWGKMGAAFEREMMELVRISPG